MSAVSQDARWQGTRTCGCRGRKGQERGRAVTGRGTPEKWTGAAKWGLVGSSSYAVAMWIGALGWVFAGKGRDQMNV